MTETPSAGHNNPTVLVELTPDLAAFVVENCESNLALGLNVLQSMPPRKGNEDDRKQAEKVVAMIEQFRGVRTAVQTALDKQVKS